MEDPNMVSASVVGPPPVPPPSAAPALAVPPPSRRRRRGAGRWIVPVLLGVLLLGSLLVNVGLGTALMGKGLPTLRKAGGGVDEFPAFEEIWSYGSGDTKAVRIPLEGVIMRSQGGSLFSGPYDMVSQTLEQIRAARHDASVRAILLEVDSPGGAVTPSDEIYRELLRFRRSDPARRVVVFVRDMAASGAYWVSMSADWIVAEPTAVVGSIGVLVQSYNFQGLGEKIGVRDTTITSGINKDLLNPWRETRDEELAIFQGLVDDLYRRFSDLVMEQRKLQPADMATIADGRIFTAEAAFRHRLVDEVGYFDEALGSVERQLGGASVYLVRYHRAQGFLRWLTEASSPMDLRALTRPSAPRVMSILQH